MPQDLVWPMVESGGVGSVLAQSSDSARLMRTVTAHGYRTHQSLDKSH